MPDPSSPFAALPLEEQLRWLERALARGEDPRGLLQACAAVRDHAPLSWLTRALLERGFLADPAQQGWLAEFLLQQPETAVDRVLRALVGEGRFPGAQGPQLQGMLLAVLERVTLSRVSVMCLVDRALKHNFAEARDAHVQALTERCAAALREGRLEEVTVDRLAQVSAPGLAILRQEAAAHGPSTAAALEDTLRELALRTLEVLGEAPKAVSQANAEELLSKRVYTDPGHFLVELLQNAEDAGARCFRLQLTPQRIVVWHDGQPFDTRDVVGVTSIGQTTKRKQQIGFFGVGFKSVYEVTDRPRIYSDLYRFEIADVSIPKPLSSRPADVPADGTVLVLPLRNPADPQRSPAALFRKARDLDAIVLFTLRRIDVIELELLDEAGAVTRHAVHELPPDARGISRIRQEPEGWVRGYAVHDAEHVYTGGARAPGRADSTRVMVGLRVDEHGVPRALEEDTPTIYSYLPTEERSGLRFFVQGHFDVPVDRERITQDSRWNEWILSKVPEGLASLATGLTAGLDESARSRVATGLLCVLPLPAELGSPIVRRLVTGLRKAFAGLPIVPCDDGTLQPPSAALRAEEELAALYEGEPLRTAAGTMHLVRRDLPARAIELAQALGVASFGVGELVDGLEHDLATRSDGGYYDDRDAPPFVRQPNPARLAALYEVLDAALMRRTGAGPRRLCDLETLRRLRALPLVLSEQEGLYRPHTGIVRAEPALREIYAGLRAFVHPELDAAVDPEDPARATATAFLERLGVGCVTVRDLVVDLEARLGGHEGPVADLGTTSFPGTPQRLRAALALLADAPAPLQRRAARLPVFLAQDGRYHRAAANASDRGGVLRYEPGRVADALLGYYGDARPVCAPQEDDPALALLRSARAPTLSLSSLVADVRARAATLSAAELERLHALLEAVRDDLPARTRRELAELPIWPDVAGVPRPLRGEGAARLPASPAIAALLPEVPFLHPSVLARRHAHDMGGEEVGLAALVEALSPEAVAPLRIEPSAASVTAVLEILRADKDAIQPRLRARLAEVPAFLDDEGRPARLDALVLVEDPALRAVYAGWPQRRFVEPGSPTRAAIAELELDGRLARADAAMLAKDLAGLSDRLDGQALLAGPLPLVGDAEHLTRLLRYCAEQASALPRTVLKRLAGAAVFPDQHDRLGPLGDAGEAPYGPDVYASDEAVRPIFAAAGVRVLAAWAQPIAEPLLEAVGRGRLTVVAMVEHLAGLTEVAPGQQTAPVQSAEVLTRVQQVLIDEAPLLAHRFPPVPREGAPPSSPALGRLAIWPTVAGGVIAAERAIDSAELAAWLPLGTPARARLDAVTLEPAAAERLRRLAPLLCAASASAFAAERVQAEARPGEPLSRQPAWLREPAAVARLAALIGPEHPTRPWVDATEHLRLEPLSRADAETVALVLGTPLAERLLHPRMAEALPDAASLPELEPAAVIDALAAGVRQPRPRAEHPVLHEDERRQRFHAWLEAREAAVFTDADARDRLRTLPLFSTDRGTLRPADQLVIDPDLPQLPVDWTPHPELPAATLSLLVRHLGVGRPPVEDLVVDHLAPAYRKAAAAGDGPGAARLLEYLARALASTPSAEIRALLSGEAGEGPVRVEGAHGRFVPATVLLLPTPELAPAAEAVFGSTHPCPHPRLPSTVEGLLEALGVERVPPRAWVADAMRGGVASVAAAAGLAVLVARLHRSDPAATVAELPLREAAWVLDGHDVARRPGELFAWTADVQALVGDAPGLYAAPEIARALGEELGAALGFRTARDVRLPEVVAHLDHAQRAGIPVAFRVYAWLERGLAEGWLDGAELRRRLQGRAWVCSDDGEYHPHERVLGLRALEHFGPRRGYWERGRQECPALCRLFGIAERLTPAVLMAFLEEIARDAKARGDRGLLEAEPGLPRMLQRSYAALGASLGRAGDVPPAPMVLCRQHGGDEDGALRLRPPEDPLVLRSDAPALEQKFAAAGRFFVATVGPLEERADIDAYYERCGIRRLRESYEVRVVDAGQDQTAAHGDGLHELRACLRGLLAVLPRVRLQRTHLSAEAWVYETRLTALARSGPIRARDGLEVDYVLPGVGHARTRAVAVFDPGTSTLLVDTRVLTDPDAVVTGLAQGLLPCLYDGPDEEQLVDIVEILLRLRTRARMDDYLDQRFFPTAAEPQPGPGGRLATRVGELFDYGLDRRLVARFGELQGRPLERWREPSAFEGLPDGDEPAVRTLVARLLAAVEVEDPSQALVEALALLLSATSLSDVPAGLLAPPTPSEPAPLEPLEPLEPQRPSGDHAPSLEELEARLAELTARSGRAEPSEGAPPPFVIPRDAEPPVDAPRAPTAARSSVPVTSWADVPEVVDDERASEPPTERSGFWQRLARRLGLADEAPPPEPRPAWASPGANVLSPSRFIGPQLWVRGRALRELATHRMPMGMLHQPRVLPSPHRYVVHTLGVAFDSGTQQWHPRPLPRLPALFDGERHGTGVSFAGTLMPGRSVLPVPLYGDVVRLEVVGASPQVVRPLGRLPGGSAVVDVTAEAPVRIRYEIGLRRPPTLTEGRAPELSLPGPTVPRERLPGPVREWLDRNASSERGAWEQARRVEAFVQRHYVYDLEFRERPEVERAARELRPGEGNHHLTLLHASADRDALGYGVCYELNVLVVELLRHLGVPALVAIGWMLDEGFADRPDHLFALALVPSASGPCLLPLDASTGPRGPVRPLHGAAPPAVELQPHERPPVPQSGGGWGTPVLPGPERDVAVDEHVHALHRTLRTELDREREALRRVVRIADTAHGRGPSHLPPHEELPQLRQRAVRALGDPARLAPMLAVIRGEYESAAEVPEVVRALVRDGLAVVESFPSYRVRAADG